MNPELSTYLNLLRVLGALGVFLGHMCIWKLSCGVVDRLPYLAGDGVVMFFVLSGYVVSYTVDTKDRTIRAFAINRCARIYSVMLPALILTVVLACIGIWRFPESYGNGGDYYQLAKIWLYLPMWLSFSSEFWGLNEPILNNSPFWSLCFEVWFYIFFATTVFMQRPARVVAMVVIALVVGPKVCLLFPLWWLGVLAYRTQQKVTLAPTPARVLLLLSIGAYLLIRTSDADSMVSLGVNAALQDLPRTHLQMAWTAPGDFMIAVCVTASIFAMRFATLHQLARFSYPVSVVASFTFTIYLTHMPLLEFFVAFGGTAIDSMFWPTIMTLVVVVALGLATERRIGPWRRAFTRLLPLRDRTAGSVA